MADLAVMLVLVLAIGLLLAALDVLALNFGVDSRESYPDDHRRPLAGGAR